MKQQTLAIIKPDGVRDSLAGIFCQLVNGINHFTLVEAKHLIFSEAGAMEFYAEHRGKPFFDGLIQHATSGPCIAIIIEGDDAVAKWRNWIGPSDPAKGHPHCHLRALFGRGMPNNAFHGSDSPAAAQREIGLVFPEREQVIRGYLDVPAIVSPVTTHLGSPVIKLLRLSGYAVLPTKGTPDSAGWDVYAAEEAFIGPGETRTVSLGWKAEIPSGYEIQVRCRSGLACKGVRVANSPGTVDSDYRGEMKVILTSDNGHTVKCGDRIAQFIVAPVTACNFQETQQLSATSRGEGGFGSTGA